MRLRFIPTIYHNVLRFLGTSSTREFQGCEIPFDQIHIEAYCDRLQVQYCIDGSRRMNDFYVEKIKIYKSRGASKHEYLAAKVRAPNGTSFYLAFECGRSKIICIAPPLAKRDPFFKMFAFSSSSSTFDSLFYRRKVDGKVTPLDSSGKHKGNHVLFHTLSFPAPGPSMPAEPTASPSSHSASEPQPGPCHLYLYELAVLVSTLHKMKSQYLLFSDKSYFYAGTIIKVLQEKYHPVVVVKTCGSRRLDRFWEQPVLDRKEKRKQKESRAGTWNKTEVCAKEMAPLKDKFRRDLRDFRNQVCFFS